MWYEHLHKLITYLHNHPDLGGLIAYAIALAESLAIIGTVIPGSVTMTAIGALIGAGILPATSTMLWAIAGAFTGDFISYWIGYYYNDRLRRLWPFSKYPQWLRKGEDFFHKHGGKSVVIGRFAGPARSLVPLIAGLLKMRLARFTLAAMPSACLWALVYMVPGILIGALSLELPPAKATKFILAFLLIITIVWLIFWFIHFSFTKIAQQIDRLIAKFWCYLKQHRSLHWITTLLNDPRYPEHHQQLTLGLFTVICGLLFIAVWLSSATHSLFAHFNQPLFELLRSLRNRTCDDILIPFTLLGDKHTLLTAAGLIFVWLAWQRYWSAAWHWFSLVAISTGSAEVIKKIYFSLRPQGILNQDPSSSFPSGHATLSVAILGFLAVLIARELSYNRRYIPYVVASILAGLVCLSRLYLGAHWFTDVFGGALLGLASISIVTVSYRRQPTPHIPSRAFTVVSVLILLVVWLGYGVPHFRKTEIDYSLYWPSLTLNNTIWWQHQNHQIPLYVADRLGKPKQPLNIEWLGSLSTIENSLVAQGWQAQSAHINLKTTLHQLSIQNNKHHVPLLPTLYHNHVPVLLLTKPMANNHLLTLELWQSNITLTDSKETLWLGSVSDYLAQKSTHRKNIISIIMLHQA